MATAKNPIKTQGTVNMVLLIVLLVMVMFIVFAKQKSSDGTVTGFFNKKDEEDEIINPVAEVVKKISTATKSTK